MPIDDKFKVAKGVEGLAGAILPAFKPTDLNREVEHLIRDDPVVAEYVKRNPLYKQRLLDIAKVQYPKYRSLIRGANMVDSADRLLSAGGMIADGLGPGTAGAG